jgi:uncharacterized SAM-binding protein YcdF (DUF218 family)
MRTFFLVIFLAVLAYGVGFLVFLDSLPTPPAHPRADGIVALTGGDARLDTAVMLLEHGVGRRLLISGAAPATSKSMLGRMSAGGPRFACCADVGYAAEDTHGNAEEAAEWARAHDFKSLLVVTARYHMPRALREFETAMPDETLVAYPVSPERIDLEGWWGHPKTAALLQREYVKYLASLAMTALSKTRHA